MFNSQDLTQTTNNLLQQSQGTTNLSGITDANWEQLNQNILLNVTAINNLTKLLSTWFT